MPIISRFLGIVVQMYDGDHNPPHFHVQYNEHKAIFEIKTLNIIAGKLPAKVRALVVERAQDHQDELLANRKEIENKGIIRTISPLV